MALSFEDKIKPVSKVPIDTGGLSFADKIKPIEPAITPKDQGIISKGVEAYKTFARGAERIATDVGIGEIQTAASMLSGLDWLGIKPAGKVAAKLNEMATKAVPPDQTFVDQLAQGAGSAASFFIPGIGIAKGVQLAGFLGKTAGSLGMLFGNSASTALEALSEAGSVYDQNKKDGKSEDEASGAATKTFWANALLIGLTNRFGAFNEDIAGFIKRSLYSAPSEAVQEGAQQVISNLATGRPYNEGVGESALIGGILGGVMGGISGIAIPPQKQDELKKKAQDAINAGASPLQAAAELSSEVGVEKAKEIVASLGVETKPIAELPDEQNIADRIGAGESPAAIKVELSQTMGATEATAFVDRASAMAPTVEETTKKLRTISEKALEKTPAALQEEFTKASEEHKTILAEIEKRGKEARAALEATPEKSAKKKEAKLKLEKTRAEYRAAEKAFEAKQVTEAQSLRTYLGEYIPKKYKVAKEQVPQIVEEVMARTTEPEHLLKTFSKPVSQIVENVVAERQQKPAVAPAVEKKPEKVSEVVSEKKAPQKGKEVAKTTVQDIEILAKEAKTPDEFKKAVLNKVANLDDLANVLKGSKYKDMNDVYLTVKLGEKTAKPVQKAELNVGDVIDTKGKSNMKGRVTITSIEKNTVKFTDEEGTTYAGMAKSTVKTLVKEGSWVVAEEKPQEIAPKAVEGVPPELDIPAELEARANEDWIDNYSEQYGNLDARSSILAKQAKEQKGAAQKLSLADKAEVDAEMARMENEFVDKWRAEAAGEKNLKPTAINAKKEFIFDQKTTEMDRKELKRAGFGVEALGFEDYATVLTIDNKPAIAFTYLEGALAGFSVAKDFRRQGLAIQFLSKEMTDNDGSLRVTDANENMLAVLKKLGNVSEPDGTGTITVTAFDKEVKKIETKGNGKPEDIGVGTGEGQVPEPAQPREKQPRGAGRAVEVAGQGERGKERPAKLGYKLGERSGARLTNEEISEAVNSVTSVAENGVVEITGEITDDILEAVGQYSPAGKTKEGRGILDEYYTNSQIVDMVKSLIDFPAKDMRIFEPAAGTGNFLYAIPEIGNHKVAAMEINGLTARIMKILHPSVKVANTPFESLFITERGEKIQIAEHNLADLIIGNPPYGEHRGKYLGLGEEKGLKKYEDYFVKRGLDMLKEGGTLAMVLPSSYLDRKTEIKNAVLEKAYRLPNGVFEGTDVGTDIVILQKKKGATAKPAEYFKENPEHILGEVKTRKNRFGKEEDYVDGTLEDAIGLFAQNNNAAEAKTILKEIGEPATAENVADAEEAIDEAGGRAKELLKAEKTKGKKIIEKKIIKKSAKIGEPVSLMTHFEGQFTDEEIAAWQDTQSDGTLINPEKHGALANYLNGKWYIDFNYAQGDIYEKLGLLDRDLGLKNIDKTQYERQKAKLEAVLPRRETVDDIKLSPNVSFVSNLNMETGAVLKEKADVSLRSMFLKWLEALPRQAFGDSSNWEVREYINNEQVRGSDKDRNELVRIRRKEMAESLFNKFLKEGLTAEEKSRVEDAYNETFNFNHIPDYKKVPMFSAIHQTFNGKPFELRDVQKHGIGRLVNNGVGILAHDVGFGKTISGVVAIHETMHRGWAKKPLVIVPSENVYQQWINTINELVPNAKLNLLSNLGADFKGNLADLQIADGSITLITYEGFKRLSFQDDTYDSLSSKFNYVADDLTKHRSARDEEKAKARGEEVAGKMKRGTRADIFFEALGFDHITFDEVHNANHIVSKVKLKKGEASEYNRFTLRPSDLGIKTWLASQYIQQKNDGRNVNLLSATPFTNHPLEYYSVLSLVADKAMQKMGFLNVNDFFGTFMEAENEYEFKADGTYQKKTDIRRFRNFRQFRKLLDSYIDFKDGDAEGIVRPTRVQQTYEIPPNDLTNQMEAQAQAIFKENEKEGAGAKTLRAITELRKIAFSPYASKFAPDISPKDYKKFVEDSPKIKVLMGLIARNKEDKNEAGQIIYVDQVGVQFMPMMKDYLVKELGYKVEEVEIISGAVQKTKRLEIQEKYNKGEIKIVLGSEAIKEGMNLQENTSDLYILSLPWNFTQLRQVIGRAWRQGNKWKNVRINNLFMQDSIDVFLSQKLENKQKRYEASVKSGDNDVDVGDVSYDELKFLLIKDPAARAKLEIAAQKERLSQEIVREKAEMAFATRKLEKINDIAKEIADTTEYLARERKQQEEAVAAGKEFSDYWIKRYEDDLTKLEKQQKEELAKLAEKGIDTASLTATRIASEAKIAELTGKLEELDNNLEARTKEIIATMPPRTPFSQTIVDSFVADRTEQNKTFYELREDNQDKLVKVKTEKRQIKNAAGTKVIKTKTISKAVREDKPKIEKRGAKDAVAFAVINDTSLSAAEKVNKLLDVKQQGKEFKDIGERVSGSKKERAAIRTVMEYGDNGVISEMIDRVGYEAVLLMMDKNEILEDTNKPDMEEDKKSGVPAVISKFKNDVFDTIARHPRLMQVRRYSSTPYILMRDGRSATYVRPNSENKEAMTKFFQTYPDALRTFVSELTAIRTEEDVTNFSTKYRRQFYTEYDQTLDIEQQKGLGMEIGILGGVDTLLGYAPGGVKINAGGVGKALRAVKSNQEQLALAEKGEAELAYYKDANGKPLYFGINEYGRFTAFKTAKEAVKSIKDNQQMILDQIEQVLNGYDHYFKDRRKKSTNDTDLKHGNFKPLDRIERSGTAIPEEKVAPATLVEDYGFKSVQFGNYMDDEFSREHIRHTIGAIEDLGKILGVNIKNLISSNGLSMAYGARGGGGNAIATYNPAKNIINLTKKKGDGSFGHEFMHFLDGRIGARTHRGKWSKGNGYGRQYTTNAGLETQSQAINKALQNGVEIEEEQTFKPEEPEGYYADKIIEWRKDGKNFEEAKSSVVKDYKYQQDSWYQAVSDVYREEFTATVKKTSQEYYENSEKYGGRGSYWVRNEELWARAFQGYLEDKMTELGMKNNYLTHSTEGFSVYPQGKERAGYKKLFDDLFKGLAEMYPVDETKLKTTGEVKPTYTQTDAAAYLTNLKERLKLDFDVHFVDVILAQNKVSPISPTLTKRIEAFGATADNTIAIAKELAAYTAEHEVVHLTLANLEKIPIFVRNGLTREKLMSAKATQLGIENNANNALQIEEGLAKDFELYRENKMQPRGIIRKFFALLKQAILRFARAINTTRGDIIKDYFDVLDEGVAVSDEMMRLENKGVLESFIEDGQLIIPEARDVSLATKIAPEKARKIADEMLATDDYFKHIEAISKLSDEELRAFMQTPAGDQVFFALENEMAFLYDMLETPQEVRDEVWKFKVKDEGDKRLRNMQEKFNTLLAQQQAIETKLAAWKLTIEKEIVNKEAVAEVIEGVKEPVKELARFTTRTKPPKGTLTNRGLEEVEKLEFADPQAAQEEIYDYLKRKTELVETRNRLSKLRADIAQAKRTRRMDASALRDVERRLKLRKQMLERNDHYISLGVGRGKKEQLKVMSRRNRVIGNAQDAFAISDLKAKELIGGRRIHLMSEESFNDFLVEFSNRAQEIRSTIDARDAVTALIEEKDFKKEENLQRAMGLPPLAKMTDEQANRYFDALSKHQFGDIFITTRMLETAHRTDFKDVKTVRELEQRAAEKLSIPVESFRNLKAADSFTSWISLSRQHPFWNWIIGKRIVAKIEEAQEVTAVQEIVSKLLNAARASRRANMKLKDWLLDVLIPTDDILFGYFEAENKEQYAKEKEMTKEELAFADYAISYFHSAYEYQSSEYGMRGRKNYITHIRRNFLEALKDDGVKAAFQEVFTSQQEDEAVSKILSAETGKVLAFEKWFPFAQPRSGQLIPSKNVGRAMLAYATVYARKKALDKFVPTAMMVAHIHKFVVGTTEKGLSKDPTFEASVKKFVNDAKGRKIDFDGNWIQNSPKDIYLRTFLKFITFKFLGGRAGLAFANLFGDFAAISRELSLKEIGTGLARSMEFAKANKINKQYRYFTGRNPFSELFDPQYNMPERITNAFMVLMQVASFQSQKFFLRAKLTEEQWNGAIADDEFMAEIAKSLSRAKPNQFYINSMAGNTTLGKGAVQFMSWTFPLFNSTFSDARQVIKTLKAGKGWDTLKTEEAQLLVRTLSRIGVLAAIVWLFPDDDDDTLYGKTLRQIKENINTIWSALWFPLDPDKYALALGEAIKVFGMFKQLATWEKYKQDGKGYGIGDLKATETFGTLITPTAFREWFPKEKVDSKEVIIQEAIKTGDFSASKIAEFLNPDEWNDVDNKRTEVDQKEYREKKIGEITQFYNARRKYPNNKIVDIMLTENKNDKRIEKMLEYAKTVGRAQFYAELRRIRLDRDLLSNPKKHTGALISSKLFDEIRRKLSTSQ